MQHTAHFKEEIAYGCSRVTLCALAYESIMGTEAVKKDMTHLKELAWKSVPYFQKKWEAENLLSADELEEFQLKVIGRKLHEDQD